MPNLICIIDRKLSEEDAVKSVMETYGIWHTVLKTIYE